MSRQRALATGRLAVVKVTVVSCNVMYCNVMSCHVMSRQRALAAGRTAGSSSASPRAEQGGRV
jgi:hypothetical protein